MAMTVDEQIEIWCAAIGQQIALDRKQMKLSQKEAGKLIGLSQKTMSDVETGKSPILRHYIRCCIFYDIDYAIIVARARVIVRSQMVDEPAELHG